MKVRGRLEGRRGSDIVVVITTPTFNLIIRINVVEWIWVCVYDGTIAVNYYGSAGWKSSARAAITVVMIGVMGTSSLAHCHHLEGRGVRLVLVPMLSEYLTRAADYAA